MDTAWESDLASLLAELSAAQDRSLEILTRKRELLAAGKTEDLAALGKEEEQVIQALERSLARRQEILERAGREGLPSDSIRSLTEALPGDHPDLAERVHRASLQARLLQHHSLTNWVLVQRSLLHLSQMLEIVATGSTLQPTYGKGEPTRLCGALVDRAV
ncbi:MAG TPA: flagellar protein FlgN [Planctomycetaceae bacterium]|nr:flagellar protein FlgN [Planctomycetaceae bacterium]HIQ19843.1 flagellar protein FlgN [Planctomycetota bacterium]